jgi:hypothetical protein
LSICLAAIFAASPALAGDNIPPPWPRIGPDGLPLPGVTFQCWTFPTPFHPEPPDPGWWNPHGVPFGPRIIPADPLNPPIWLEEFGGRFGVWCLNPGDMLEFDIPNWFMPPPFEKFIWVQIKHLFGPPRVDVIFPSPVGPLFQPAGPVATVPVGPPGTPWVETAYGAGLPFCPEFETIKITALEQMYIDQVCIDTLCIPAPGAAALLAVGGLVAVRRRRD